MPSIVTRPVITSMAPAIRLNWRTVVAVTWGWRQWKSVTISTIGEFRCGLRVVVLHNATLHDNGPPHLIFGEGIALVIEFIRDVHNPDFVAEKSCPIRIGMGNQRLFG